MTYAETLDYLYKKLPMFSRMGSAAFKKDLTNTIALCNALGNPQTKFKSIHVGGTNGKGSVSHMLAAIFQTAGYKTGLYTSPHLYDFRERIKVNGEMVSEAFVTAFVEQVKPLIEKLEPSFFEITVAMAFQYFAEQNVDIAIVEVGLGGRLDSTNIITPELSIITNIGWDHMNMLGNSLEEIAGEKAGIIKSTIPVVIGETLSETKAVFLRKAEEQKAPIKFAEDEFKVTIEYVGHHHLRLSYSSKESNAGIIETDLPGTYQALNVRTVLTALKTLKSLGWKISDDTILCALKNVTGLTGLMGRWQVIGESPTVVLEVAHNKPGVEQMLVHINRLQFKTLRIIIGMVKDKDVDDVLKLLPPSATYYFTQASIPRALPAEALKEKGENIGLIGDTFGNVNLALQAALLAADADDLIIVCGSIFLVAEVQRDEM